MKRIILLAVAIGFSIQPVHGESRSSANYSITTEAIDSGGLRTSSANYVNDGSLGLIIGLANDGSGTLLVGSGYIAQLIDDTATPTPTPPAQVQISGTVTNCSSPLSVSVPNVTITLTGSASVSTLSDAAGNYTLSSLPSGGNYLVTPAKSALLPGSSTINTIDVIAIQRHFLNISFLPPGCRVIAANVNGDLDVNTIDVVAVQRFFLGMSAGIAGSGHTRFNPPSRTYQGISTDQGGQNYGALVLGDVAAPFASRDGGSSQNGIGTE